MFNIIEMVMMTQVQIQNEAVYVSQSPSTLKKTVFFPAMSKQ